LPQEPQEVLEDGRLREPASYALLHGELKSLYMKFYQATYKESTLSRRVKELIAIGASMALGCKGCLEGHLKKAIKEGATPDEVSETIAVALGVGAAAIVDKSDIAAANLVAAGSDLYGKLAANAAAGGAAPDGRRKGGGGSA
jgi:AhpD family alkylhydroperoxidase